MKVILLLAVLTVAVNSFSLRDNIRREFDHAERMIDHLGEFVKENVNTGFFRNLLTFKERLVHDVLKATGLMPNLRKSTGKCTRDVLKTLPNGDVVYVRQNVCNDTPTENNVDTSLNLPVATSTYSTSSTAVTEEATTEATTTEATTPNNFTTVEETSTEHTTQESNTIKNQEKDCEKEMICQKKKELLCKPKLSKRCGERKVNCRTGPCQEVLRNICDDLGQCETKLSLQCSEQEICDTENYCTDIEESECKVEDVEKCEEGPNCKI